MNQPTIPLLLVWLMHSTSQHSALVLPAKLPRCHLSRGSRASANLQSSAGLWVHTQPEPSWHLCIKPCRNACEWRSQPADAHGWFVRAPPHRPRAGWRSRTSLRTSTCRRSISTLLSPPSWEMNTPTGCTSPAARRGLPAVDKADLLRSELPVPGDAARSVGRPGSACCQR